MDNNNFDYNQQNFWNVPPTSQFTEQQQQQFAQQSQGFTFEMPDQFGQELNFQNFNTIPNQQMGGAGGMGGGGQVPTPSYESQYPNSSFLDPMQSYGHSDLGQQKSFTGNDFEDEPPLLEELGINPSHILQKTLSVLNPFRTPNREIFEDTDLAGPLVFCLAFGSFLLLSGKVTFSYIYGIGVLGCISCYCLLSLMSQNTVTLGAVVSVLGYCLLPMVCLSGLNVVITIQGMTGTILTGFAILWCAVSASKLFVTALSMDHQQLLVAYPCALLYGVFALITIF